MEDLQTVRWALVVVTLSTCNPKDQPRDANPSTTTLAPSTSNPNDKSSEMINEWVERIARGDVVTNDDFNELQPLRELALQLVAAFRTRAPKERKELVEVLVHLGVTDTSCALCVQHPIVVSALASMLSDPAPEVRNSVASAFAERVPDDVARNHAEEILSAIAKHPDLDRAAWIVGRLGSQRGRELIASGKVGSVLDVDRDIILGKLGDGPAEQRSLERYREAMKRDEDYSDVPRWTERIGYMATPGAVVALARDLRHPGVYPYHHAAERSVRADVVDGLRAAFPYEAAAHLPNPESNADYERIEHWVTTRLGVTWNEPRPPFVYQAPSPTF